MQFTAFEEQIHNLVNVKGSKRANNFDAQSEAQTIYQQQVDDNFEGKSMKSKKSYKQKQKQQNRRQEQQNQMDYEENEMILYQQ